jgi:hypothetical protein
MRKVREKKQLLIDVEIRNKNDENARAQEMHEIAKRKALLELASSLI